jgi:peptide/nickel transport system ATP-binding protein
VSDGAALDVHELRVELVRGSPVVEDVSFTVRPGEILGIVGESGSGKTTTALALLAYARPGAEIRRGTVEVRDEELLAKPERSLRRSRGRLVSYIAQDPASALNPSMRVGDQIAEMLRFHTDRDDGEAAVANVLERVHLPSDRAFQRRFVHQLSGGQQQRLAIAVAIVCSPPVVVMDEPTTGLDVVTQARILAEIDRLRRESRLAIVYVSHDILVVGSIADRIAVMYAGRVIEEGPTATLLAHPRHPYTRGLIASVPDHTAPRRLQGIPGIAVGVGERPPGCCFAPRCMQRVARCETEMPELDEVGVAHRVRCFEWARTPELVPHPPHTASVARAAVPLVEVESLRAVYRSGDGEVVAADDVSFAVAPGECVAIVGESGSGKTTIARCVAGLHKPVSGRILLEGVALPAEAKERTRIARRRIQIVFQNPYDSLNPRHKVRDSVARPARVLRNLSASQAASEVVELLELVRLPARLAGRYPGELSGGERQRVAIARALAAKPDLVICDEITSALDVSVQAAVLDLLASLRAELGLALLFISHDLGVVASVSDRILVLERGVIREQGDAARVLTQPSDPYTKSLVDAISRLPVTGAVSVDG